MTSSEWTLIGKTDELINELAARGCIKELEFDKKKVVLTYHDGVFGALNNKCNHMGGPLSRGKLKNGCIECPWHYWEFNHKSGESLSGSAEPLSSKAGSVPTFPLKIENGSLYINISGETKRVQAEYNSGIMNLSREPKREDGKIRVL